jgi:alpha-ribazole phosphatase
MIIHLIRHGRTEPNEKHLYCGRTDPPLSEAGRRALIEIREKSAYPTADAYITSGMARTAETLRILYHREPDFVMDEFREMDFGDFEMKSYDDLKEDPDYLRWIGDIGGTACPHGESQKIFEDRVARGLSKLSEMTFDSVAIICHAGVIVAVMERRFPGQRNYYEWQPQNGRGYTIDVSPAGAALISEI